MSICQAEKGFGWEKSIKNCRGLGLQNPELRGKILPMSGIEIKSSSRLENLVVVLVHRLVRYKQTVVPLITAYSISAGGAKSWVRLPSAPPFFCLNYRIFPISSPFRLHSGLFGAMLRHNLPKQVMYL